MSPLLVYLLLALALLVPVVAAIGTRLFAQKLSEKQVTAGFAVVFVLAIASALVLARSDVSSLSVGNLTLVLPLTGSSNIAEERPLPDMPPSPQSSFADTMPITRSLPLTNTISPVLGDSESMTVTTPLTQPGNVEVVPTIAITATIPTPVEEPTAPVEEEPTTPVEEEPTTPVEEEPAPVEEEPTTPVEEEPAPVEEEPAPVEEEPAPVEEEPAPQVYVVQPGDTLRSIAEQLGVDIMDLLQVNGMTIEDADSIYPGQELVVP